MYVYLESAEILKLNMSQFIFDTNYYRNKFHEISNFCEFEEQIKTEKEKGFKVLFPIIVALELLNHFNDEDKTSNICYNSLILLSKHSYDDSGYQIIPTIYPLLSHHIFNKKSNFDDLNKNVFNLSQNVNVKNLEEIKSEFKDILHDIENFIVEEKKIIIANIKNNYIAKLSSNSEEPNWEVLRKDENLNKEFRKLIKDSKMHKIIGLAFINMAAEQTNSSRIPFSKDYFEKVFFST